MVIYMRIVVLFSWLITSYCCRCLCSSMYRDMSVFFSNLVKYFNSILLSLYIFYHESDYSSRSPTTYVLSLCNLAA